MARCVFIAFTNGFYAKQFTDETLKASSLHWWCFCNVSLSFLVIFAGTVQECCSLCVRTWWYSGAHKLHSALFQCQENSLPLTMCPRETVCLSTDAAGCRESLLSLEIPQWMASVAGTGSPSELHSDHAFAIHFPSGLALAFFSDSQTSISFP